MERIYLVNRLRPNYLLRWITVSMILPNKIVHNKFTYTLVFNITTPSYWHFTLYSSLCLFRPNNVNLHTFLKTHDQTKKLTDPHLKIRTNKICTYSFHYPESDMDVPHFSCQWVFTHVYNIKTYQLYKWNSVWRTNLIRHFHLF